MYKRVAQFLTLALWAGVISAFWLSVTWGRELQRTAPEVFLGAAPLIGRNFRDGWDWRFGWGLVGAALIGALVVVAAVRGWYETARLRMVVATTSLGAGLFALLLALTDGADGVLHGADDETEYLANLPTAPPAGDFVRNFVVDINDYTVHVRGHPPGFVVLLKFIDAIGLTGPWPVAMLSLLSTMALPGAVLLAVWAIAGADWVRRTAPFLVVAPYALWMMTSADAFYTALGAWGVAFVALGVNRDGRGGATLGAIGGFALAMLLFMTYGGALYMIIPLTIAVAGWITKRKGATGAVIGAVMMAGLVTLAWLAAGFWWFDGAEATQFEYWEGTAQFRIWNYFIFANLVVTLFAIGPASFVGMTKLRIWRMWVLVGGSFAALIVADLSQLSKAEVERIWLIFFPWLALAAGALVVPVSLRFPATKSIVIPKNLVWGGWLGLQASAAIVLQAVLVSKW